MFVRQNRLPSVLNPGECEHGTRPTFSIVHRPKNRSLFHLVCCWSSHNNSIVVVVVFSQHHNYHSYIPVSLATLLRGSTMSVNNFV